MAITVYDNSDYLDNSSEIKDFESIMQNSINDVPLDKKGGIIDGIIRSIDTKKGLACIDVSLKSEGFVPISEFFLINEKEELQVGQKVKVLVLELDNKNKGIILSRAVAIREESWDKLIACKESGELSSGLGFSRVKGGVSIDFNGVLAFLPGSQIDVRPVRDVSDIIGHFKDYKVIVADKSANSAIVSRKAVLEGANSEERDDFLDSVKAGDIIEGIVKNITHYGAFVDLGVVDGLLHVTDIMWEKISHPSEVLSVGQKVNVKVIRYDRETKRLSLGMKHLTDNPWSDIKEKYSPGALVKGKVVNITSYGAFVQLEPGIEGLLHVSEISWAKDSYKKHKDMAIGQELDVVVLEIDIDKHRIALSIRQATENPWEKFAKQYSTGQIFEGTIRNVTDFGVFVGLPNVEVDGLVHVSDLSWNNNQEEELSKYKKDDLIKVAYLGSDLENHRIKLGVKQLTEDPVGSQIKDELKVGSTVTCSVIEIKPDGIVVDLFGHIQSFIPKSQLAREKVEQRAEKFVVGDRIDARIIRYDPNSREVALSVRDYEEDEHKKTIRKYGAVDTGATIGTMLGEAIQTAMLEEKSDSDDGDSDDSKSEADDK